MSPSRPPGRKPSALRELLSSETAGGGLVMAAALLALIVANSPAAEGYFHALHLKLGPLSALHWINDGLMAGFFLFVGLEIKREFLDGQLATWPNRALPCIAAAGGVAVPALIYAGLNASSPETLRGWAIPTATDIAFALGVLALAGRRAPAGLRVFLATLAIVDDLIAVAIIAVFYTAELNVAALAGAAGVIVLLAGLNRLGVTRLAPYLALGAALWVLVLLSGVHATIAGVALAMTIPLRPSKAAPDDPTSPLHRLEHALSPWIALLVVPVFAFANAGVSFAGMAPSLLLQPVTLGVAAGLFLGKQIGVFGACVLAVRLRLARLPAGANWTQLYGVALLCGIGFTMSLFIGLLAFPESHLHDEVKVGVLAGSLLSALAGSAVLALARRR
jgi:NhaA family Na+:H+ antiporter